MKTKILRGNDAPFMNKELKKAIYVRSRMKNRFNKDPCNENRAKFKQQRNKCVKLRRKAIKDHFKKATSKGITKSPLQIKRRRFKMLTDLNIDNTAATYISTKLTEICIRLSYYIF